MMFTVDTHCILPHPVLQPYVRCLAIRSFDTGENELPKPMIADHEMTMAFFIKCKLYGFDSIDKNNPPYQLKKNDVPECCFTGIQTSSKGFVIFKGATTLVNIHFKPVGFYYIFNIKPMELVNKMGDNEDILSKEILSVHERMNEASNMDECINLLEQFLIQKLSSQKSKYRHAGIMKASDFLLSQKGLYPISNLASQCNMTLQTFEVQFTEQVGINPKYFSRILRFGLAVNLKTNRPFKNWNEIANICGYYDQNHFNKEFKQFTFLTPKKYLPVMKPVFENFIN